MIVRGKRGFTLVEMLIVFAVMGILAGIALPNLQAAAFKADATKVFTDVRQIALATRNYMDDNNGTMPRSGRWGQLPADLVPYIDQMPFKYKTTEYRLLRNTRQGIVRVRVRYPGHDPIGQALSRFTNGDGTITWTSRRTEFILD